MASAVLALTWGDGSLSRSVSAEGNRRYTLLTCVTYKTCKMSVQTSLIGPQSCNIENFPHCILYINIIAVHNVSQKIGLWMPRALV